MAIGGSGGDQVLSITTDGDELFLVVRFEGTEFFSQPFEYEVQVVGKLDATGEPVEVDIDSLLGTRADVALKTTDDEEARHFNGFISRIVRGERRGRYEEFTLFMRPWLWFLGHRRNSRIFHDKTAQQIIEAIFEEYSPAGADHTFDIAGTLPQLDYCVQYDETDFAFVSRLLEDNGITYFFTHSDTAHTLMLVDDMSKYETIDGDSIEWGSTFGNDATMIRWYGQKEHRSIAVKLLDYDYLDSATALEEPKDVENPTSNTLGEMEVFLFPGGAVQNQRNPEKNTDTATTLADRATIEAERASSVQMLYTGRTNARAATPGVAFELKEPDEGLIGAAVGALLGGGGDPTRAGNYVIIGCRYRIAYNEHEAIEELAGAAGEARGFVADVVCINAEGDNFRPERITPRPIMHGPQTAVVIGADGNEIETDKHGRVKIQFHWDKRDTDSEPLDRSAWVRVAQPHAGMGFGFWSVPRVGQEVVVSFLGGDPDRPLITGSVYNDVNMIAYELPTLATVSGWRTRSSTEGDETMYNELRFDDKKDAEYVWLKAQTNYYRNVGKDAFDMVVGNETVKVKLTRKEVIGENWFVNVVKDVMHDYGKDFHTTVAGDIFVTGKATMQVHLEKDHNSKIGGDMGADVTGKLQFKSGGDMMLTGSNVHVKGGSNVTIEAGSTLTLKAGGSSIVLSSSSITIDGGQVKVNCGGSGGSATEASPAAPTDALVHEDIKPDKESDYDELFKDPIEASQSSSSA